MLRTRVEDLQNQVGQIPAMIDVTHKFKLSFLVKNAKILQVKLSEAEKVNEFWINKYILHG